MLATTLPARCLAFTLFCVRHSLFSLLPRPIANYAPGNDDLLETKNGWQAARAQANSISAMMQAQHGCGLYCSEPLAYGVGVTSIVWTTPTSTQNEPSPEAAAEAAVRSAVIYVQVRVGNGRASHLRPARSTWRRDPCSVPALRLSATTLLSRCLGSATTTRSFSRGTTRYCTVRVVGRLRTGVGILPSAPSVDGI